MIKFIDRLLQHKLVLQGERHNHNVLIAPKPLRISIVSRYGSTRNGYLLSNCDSPSMSVPFRCGYHECCARCASTHGECHHSNAELEIRPRTHVLHTADADG